MHHHIIIHLPYTHTHTHALASLPFSLSPRKHTILSGIDQSIKTERHIVSLDAAPNARRQSFVLLPQQQCLFLPVHSTLYATIKLYSSMNNTGTT